MKDRLSESAIVVEVARQALKRIVRKVIKDISQMGVTLSGDDSELANTWDEICVQIQFEQSHCWDVYDETVRAIVCGYVHEMPAYEREAIWHQTDNGMDWHCDELEDRSPHYDVETDVVQYITDAVYSEANNWSNKRIRAFIDRAHGD